MSRRTLIAAAVVAGLIALAAWLLPPVDPSAPRVVVDPPDVE